MAPPQTSADLTPAQLAILKAQLNLDQSSKLSAEEQVSLITRMAQRGIPPLGRAAGKSPRTYPRSSDVNGYPIVTSPAAVRLDGPFGPVVAVYVENTSTTADIVLIGAGQLSTAGCRIRAGAKRRFEFDTPTDSNGNPVPYLEYTILATAADPAGVAYVEVE